MVYSKFYPKFEFLPTSQKLLKLPGNFPNFHGKGRNTYLPGRMPFLSRSLIVPCCSLVSVGKVLLSVLQVQLFTFYLYFKYNFCGVLLLLLE